MATSLYPDITKGESDKQTVENIVEHIEEVNRIRETEDIGDFDNLPNRFVRGRRVERIPGDPDSVLATDEVGDLSNDSAYIYELVDEGASTPRWNRRALDFSW